jgi:hypothetical protein
VDGEGAGLVSRAGSLLLVRTAEKVGLVKGLSTALAPWRKPLATHNPGKIVLDLAIAVAVGGDCAADVSLLRTQPGMFGLVASDPTVSRLVAALAADAPKALSAIAKARAPARAAAWKHAGAHGPDHGIDAAHPLIIDLDATLLDAHSDKENATPTWKKGFGFHPLCAFIDHGPDGTGEPAAIALRAGNAGSNTAADHKTVLAAALDQLPWSPSWRVDRKVLVRTDSGGGTHEFVNYCHARRVQYSLGFTLTDTLLEAVNKVPKKVWTPAYDAEGSVREGAWVGRDHRHDRPVGPADRNAAYSAQRAPTPRRPAAVHRRRRTAADRVRHQHRTRATPRSRTPAPPPGSLRGSHQSRQRHRDA